MTVFAVYFPPSCNRFSGSRFERQEKYLSFGVVSKVAPSRLARATTYIAENLLGHFKPTCMRPEEREIPIRFQSFAMEHEGLLVALPPPPSQKKKLLPQQSFFTSATI